jgi:hypothetical protein
MGTGIRGGVSELSSARIWIYGRWENSLMMTGELLTEPAFEVGLGHGMVTWESL